MIVTAQVTIDHKDVHELMNALANHRDTQDSATNAQLLATLGEIHKQIVNTETIVDEPIAYLLGLVEATDVDGPPAFNIEHRLTHKRGHICPTCCPDCNGVWT